MKRIVAVVLGCVAGAAALGAAAAVAHFAGEQRAAPARCPDGLVAMGARCCGEGQRLVRGRCTGQPSRCSSGMIITPGGCVTEPARIAYRGGTLTLGPTDWEAEGVVSRARVEVESFALDATEVTTARWERCVEAGACAPVGSEPGAPVRGVSPREAARFCKFDGGRLPTGDEWLFAAAGASGRRFPWGPTGLVCRRTAFGMATGPCARGGTGPDLAGSRPDGATPDGALDLAGNVSEWTDEGGGRYVARGGSYRSQVAAELKSWAREDAPADAAHVGFRCAYGSAL